MTIYVNVDSMIDIITNSSSEIYTYPAYNAIETIKNIVNCILEEVGSDKKCDDLFDVSVEPGFSMAEEFYDDIENIQNNDIETFPELKAIGGANEIIEHLKSNPNIERDVVRRWADIHPGEQHEYRLSITSKDGTPHRLEVLVRNVFESVEIYDG